MIKTIQGHEDTVKSLCFNPQTENVALPVLASAGDYSVFLSDPRPNSKATILSLNPHDAGKEVEAVSISPDGSLLASGGRDGMIVLMTLFVPSLLPRTAGTTPSSAAKKQERGRMHRSYIKEFNSFEANERASDEELEVEREAQELDDILTTPQSLSQKQLATRLKRRSRADVKITELNDYATVRKRGISAKRSRKRRTKGKSFDIPSVVAHLSANTKAYGPEEPSSDESDDERKKATPKVKLTGGENIVERMAKLATPQDMPVRPPTRALDKADFGRLKKQFERVAEEEEDDEKEEDVFEDPEAEFLQQNLGTIPHSSTVDSFTHSESYAGQYGVLSQQRMQMSTSIQFETIEDRKGLFNRTKDQSDSMSDQLSDISEPSFSSDQKYGKGYHHQVDRLEGTNFAT